MQYELDTIQLPTPPVRKDENTFTQRAIVITKIVGQTYPGFVNMDAVNMEFPAAGLDADQIEASLYTQAQAFVASTYPNT